MKASPQNKPKTGRDEKGRLLPGHTANAGGRPKKLELLVERCTAAVDDIVIEKWIAEVKNGGPNWVECSKLLAAYGYGKPTQRLEHDTSTGLSELLKEVYEASK